MATSFGVESKTSYYHHPNHVNEKIRMAAKPDTRQGDGFQQVRFKWQKLSGRRTSDTREAVLWRRSLFRWFRDGNSTPIRRPWFLGCHDVGVGVVLRRQLSPEKAQNSVQCFAEKVHEGSAFCGTCYHPAKLTGYADH